MNHYRLFATSRENVAALRNFVEMQRDEASIELAQHRLDPSLDHGVVRAVARDKFPTTARSVAGDSWACGMSMGTL